MKFLSALMKRNTLLMLSAQLTSSIGSIMQTFALSLYVLKEGSGVHFASVLAVGMIPRLFGPVTGVLTDRVNRKRLLIVLDILAGVITLGFAFLHQYVFELQLPMIYILVLLLSSVQTFYDPTINAILPDIVQVQHLAETNSASSFISNASYIAVPALAGLLYSGYGLFPVMLLNGVSFLLAAMLEILLQYPRQPHMERQEKEPVFRSMVAGIREVIGKRELLIIVIISIVANLALNPVLTVGLPYILNIELKVTPELFGLSQSLLFIGPVIGSLAAGFVLKRIDYKRLTIWVLSIDTLLVLTLGIVASFGTQGSLTLQFILLSTAAFLIIGTMVLVSIALMTTIQKIVPAALMGRVMGVDTSFSIAAIPLGQWVLGFALDQYRSLGTCIAFALIVLGAALLSFIIYRPMLRNEAAALGKHKSADGVI